MPEEGTDNEAQATPLLQADEPAPFVVRNPTSTKPILLVCDHASRRFPRALGTMGLDPFARRCHLAVDIGAGPLTEKLADELEREPELRIEYLEIVDERTLEPLEALDRPARIATAVYAGEGSTRPNYWRVQRYRTVA